jgi:hypothetical protein
MTSQNEQEGFLLQEAHEDLFAMPANRVTALMTDGEGTATAVAELMALGLPEEEIFVLCGEQGLERLKTSGHHHSLKSRLYQYGRAYGRTPDWLRERLGEHIESGGLAILVPADEEAKSQVVAILARNGGFEMAHFGRLHWERVGSALPKDT